MSRKARTKRDSAFTSHTHELVTKELRRRVAEGYWRAGTLLPGRRDLARELGVALTTVQKAIEPLVADGTLTVQDRRGTFVSGEAAAGEPAPRESTVVAVIAASDREVPRDAPADLTWELSTIHALEDELSSYRDARRCRTLVPNPAEYRDVGQAVRLAGERGANALVLIDLHRTSSWTDRAAAAAASSGIAAIHVLGLDRPLTAPHVVHDQRMGGHAAAEHLVRCGYDMIRFIQPYEPEWLTPRIEGARAAVAASPLGTSAFKVASPKRHANLHDERAIGRSVASALSSIPLGAPRGKSIGLIAPNDSVAALIAGALRDRGLEPGRDVGIVSFDDQRPARLLGVSSVRPPTDQLGRTAAQLALRAAAGQAVPFQTRIAGRVVARASTRHTEGGAS